MQEVIAKTQATGVTESVELLISYAGSASAAARLVRQHPQLLCCQLPSWIKFLTAFGLNGVSLAILSRASREFAVERHALLCCTQGQVQHVLCQFPEALVEGDLVRAGESMLTFRRLGLNDYQSAQLATYYPQVGREK